MLIIVSEMKKILFIALIIVLTLSCKKEDYVSPAISIHPKIDASVVGSEIVADAKANPVIIDPGSSNYITYYNWEVGYDFKNLRTKISGSDSYRGQGETYSSTVRISSAEQAFIEGDSIECQITGQIEVIAKAGNDHIVQLTNGTVSALIYFICPEVLDN